MSSNSFVRGSLACVMSQVAAPIQSAIGDGGLYTLFAGLLALSSLGILFIARESPYHQSRAMSAELWSDRGEGIRQFGNKWMKAKVTKPDSDDSIQSPSQVASDSDHPVEPPEGPTVKGNEITEPLPSRKPES